LSSLEETVQAIVREGSPGGRSETMGVGCVKQVGFKPGVKEREGVMDEQSGESEEEVMGEGINKSDMKEGQSQPNKAGLKCLSVRAYVCMYVRPSVHKKFL